MRLSKRMKQLRKKTNEFVSIGQAWTFPENTWKLVGLAVEPRLCPWIVLHILIFFKKPTYFYFLFFDKCNISTRKYMGPDSSLPILVPLLLGFDFIRLKNHFSLCKVNRWNPNFRPTATKKVPSKNKNQKNH